ncbi:SRPBCC family protein [Hyalangium versicolor]|uniref:SRPBCC family protein n=1 Tax=Hyalangium versicolor TaxID=2861190 RepID=UPI001CCD6C78|nr:SRPBCC domain-containing protein [Hyalangium versicolor]
MSDIRIVRDYPHPPAKVWRALTDPALMALWSMRPEGFAPVVGTRFKLVAKPQPGWRGYVECEVLEAREQSVLRYSWIGDDNGKPTYVTYTLDPHAGGTRLRFEHTGFTGIGGFILAKMMMGPGWKKMLGTTIPTVLADVDDEGKLRPGSTLKPKYSPSGPLP